MKIFHTSDWHIDQLTNWTSQKSTKIENISEMSEYHLSKIEEMIDIAINEKVNVFVFAGDLFEDAISNFKEKEIITNILLKYINKLKDNGIYSIFLSGNHDIIFKKSTSSKNSLSIFSDVDYGDYLFVNKPENKEIETKIISINGIEYRFLLFPYLKGEQNKNDIKENIKNITSDGIPTILIGHIDIYGALYNGLEIQFTNLDNPNVWTPEELEELGTVANLLGHVHNHQVLGKEKKTIYCGSPFRLSFNEEKSEKGYYIHKIENNSLNSQFSTLKNNIWKTFTFNYLEEGKNFSSLLEKIKKDEIENGIIRIKLSGVYKENLKYFPYKEIKDLYQSKGVFIDRGLNTEYIKEISEINLKSSKDQFENLENSLEPKSILLKILNKNGETEKDIETMENELINILSEISNEK